MALLDTLRERAARRDRTTQVDCGKLGVLTVEALPFAECARYRDGRALLYAACRELQAAGEQMRKEGTLFRPDEVLEYLTEQEVLAAAQTILAISGADEPEEEPEPAESSSTDPPPLPDSPQETPAAAAEEPPAAEDAPLAPLLQPSAPTEATALQLRSAAPDAQVAPHLSPETAVHGGAPALQAERSVETTIPVLQESAEDFSDARAALSAKQPRTEEETLPSPTAEALAERAAEILARELRRAALVR